MMTFISPLIKDSCFGFRHVLSVCKRLKVNVSNRLINEYKRFAEDSNIESQGFMKFGEVAPKGEVRIRTVPIALILLFKRIFKLE